MHIGLNSIAEMCDHSYKDIFFKLKYLILSYLSTSLSCCLRLSGHYLKTKRI